MGNKAVHSSVNIHPILLFFIIIVEGFVTISAEVLTLRQLIPFVGNSVIVTSLIIGFFLLFLAYGYRRGGQVSRDYLPRLVKNFTIVAIWLGIGLSYFFLLFYFLFCQQYTPFNPLVALVFYLLVITAPLVYKLGQTVPIVTNMMRQESVGAISGKALHWSTIGSFLGAILTSLLLLNFLGVAWTIFVDYILLVIMIIVLIITINKFWVRIIFLIGLSLIVFGMNVIVEKNYFVGTTPYANYRVTLGQYHDHPARFMQINNSLTSVLNKQQQAYPYIEKARKILFHDLHLRHKRLLVLGAGGFTLTAKGTYQNAVTYVDIDPKIKGLVEKHFQPHIHGKFIASDAHYFLLTNKTHYDAIFFDVYNSDGEIPPSLLTQQFFKLMKAHTLNNGVVLFNIYMRPTLSDAFSKHVDNTIRAVFHNCLATPLVYNDHPQSVIYACHIEKDKTDNEIYTNDKSKAGWDIFFLYKKHLF